MTPASGSQHVLRSGDYEAHIASVGATLRILQHQGRDMVVPFAAEQVRPANRGVTLAPWPNRVVDVRYQLGEDSFQLPLTEPERQNALHGLIPWLDFACVEHGDTSVTLVARIVAQQGYPWTIGMEVTYSLGEDGLTQVVRATNESDEVAPYGTGAHPYVVAGPGPLDSWTLDLPASRVLHVTPDRLASVALMDVAEFFPERFDYREPRVLGPVEIDHAYTGLPAGEVMARVLDPSGIGVEVRWGRTCPWCRFTRQTCRVGQRRRATEPDLHSSR